MQILLAIAGLLLVLRGPALPRFAGVALLGLAALWLVGSAASLRPENVSRISEIRRERMSEGMGALVDSGWLRRAIGGKSFTFPCGQCGARLRLQYHPDRMGLISCVRCGQFAFWMQIDEAGRWRTMPEYFEGTQPPLAGRDLAALWTFFVDGFTYNHRKLAEKDPTWQSSPYTSRVMTGVCRDSATAVADWLSSRGHDASVAAGFVTWNNPEGEGHAWTVVRDGGIDYILETAGPSRFSLAKTPPRAAVMEDYFPHAYFTRQGVWVRSRDKTRVTDYRDPRLWYALTYSTSVPRP